jgi:hypothetical protein
VEAYPNQPILRTRVLSIRREAGCADVQVSLLGNVFVVKCAAERASAHVENLGCAIALGGEQHAILAEADTAHDALVVELVHEVDVERLRYARVVECEPVLAVLPVLGGHSGWTEVALELFLGTYNDRGRSGSLLEWEVVAARGARLLHRRGRGRGPIMVVCWWTTSDTNTRGVLLLVLGALGLRKVQVAIIAALVLVRVWLLLHGHRVKSGAAPARRRSNRPILTVAHRNRGELEDENLLDCKARTRVLEVVILVLEQLVLLQDEFKLRPDRCQLLIDQPGRGMRGAATTVARPHAVGACLIIPPLLQEEVPPEQLFGPAGDPDPHRQRERCSSNRPQRRRNGHL